jgi:hypothetical protein
MRYRSLYTRNRNGSFVFILHESRCTTVHDISIRCIEYHLNVVNVVVNIIDVVEVIVMVISDAITINDHVDDCVNGVGARSIGASGTAVADEEGRRCAPLCRYDKCIVLSIIIRSFRRSFGVGVLIGVM